MNYIQLNQTIYKEFDFNQRKGTNTFVNISEIIWKSNFIPGEKYYITVQACNGAGLCLSRASDGLILDDSPPVSGKVFVGSSSIHKTYIPHR